MSYYSYNKYSERSIIHLISKKKYVRPFQATKQHHKKIVLRVSESWSE